LFYLVDMHTIASVPYSGKRFGCQYAKAVNTVLPSLQSWFVASFSASSKDLGM